MTFSRILINDKEGVTLIASHDTLFAATTSVDDNRIFLIDLAGHNRSHVSLTAVGNDYISLYVQKGDCRLTRRLEHTAKHSHDLHHSTATMKDGLLIITCPKIDTKDSDFPLGSKLIPITQL